jgi:hypothetical protein
MSDGRDVAKGAILTLAPTGLGFILSGWIVGVICLFIAGSISLILWTPLGAWLGFHSDGDQQKPAPRKPPLRPGDLARRHTSLGGIQQELSVPGGRIYGSGAIQQAIFENARREDRAAVEGEFVTMIEEGRKLCEEEFTGEQSWLPYYQWRQELLEFISTVFGDAERQRFIEVEVAGPRPRDHVTAVMGWLRERRDRPESWTLNVEGEELAAAIRMRRGAGETSSGASGAQALAAQLDALMREGMELLDELMAPAQAKETGEGVWGLDFGDAPTEWWDKADAFNTRIRDLLTAEHPALLPDFERGYNERLHIQRERETVAPRQSASRSTAQKMLDFATETQRTPAKIVEACLEGLSQARKSI